MTTEDHWEQVYRTKSPASVSWFQPKAERSLNLIRSTGIALDASIIDVGGGASTLVDGLLADGYERVTVLDLSASAVQAAQARLGARAESVAWQVGDITQMAFPPASLDLWHDRAAFHFFTEPARRQAYVQTALRAIKPGGFAVMATFAGDGPMQCSGLPVQRYDAASLARELGDGFALLRYEREEHRTPQGNVQRFQYAVFRRAGER
jgi:SAM-dependent methyltransferase